MGNELTALQELRKIQSGKPRGARCTVGLTLKTLQKDEQSALSEALKDETIDANTISVWLGRKGHNLARHTVARHRRGECQCNG